LPTLSATAKPQVIPFPVGGIEPEEPPGPYDVVGLFASIEVSVVVMAGGPLTVKTMVSSFASPSVYGCHTPYAKTSPVFY
jgi:hypothetical protein